MSWTEERIDLLTRLWGEGRSASQIAMELGGVTRNAVIGKVHRLKLDNRPKTGGVEELEAELETTVAAVPATQAAPEPPVLVEAPQVIKETVAPPIPSVPRIFVAPLSPTPMSTAGKAPTAPQRSPVIHSVMGATALKIEPDEEIETEEPIQPQTGEVVPISRNLTLVQLSERTCKWPLGDPLSADFRFCGNHSHDASPYCQYHAKLAFQPASERRRLR